MLQKNTLLYTHFSLLVLTILISSCTTFRSNTFLISNLTQEEKASLIFDKNVDLYKEEVVKNNNFSHIKKIRTRFNDVLKLDPSFEDAQKLLLEMDVLTQARLKSYQATVEKFAPLEKLSETQTYDYLLAMQKIKELKPNDPINEQHIKNASALRSKEISQRNDRIKELHTSIMQEKNQQKMLVNMKIAKKSISELQTLGAKSVQVRLIENDLNKKMDDLVAQDIAQAEMKFEQKLFYEAEAAILKAEKALASLSDKPSEKINDLKYQIYFTWATQYYDTKKFQSAGYRANQAIHVNKTSEAVALKNKINKITSQRDYDSEITDILASIDSLIQQENPAEAFNTVERNVPRMSRQDNKNKLTQKKPMIEALASKIYKEGVYLYTEEDYEASIKKFQAVVTYDRTYEQAQSYLNKAQAKTKALSGAQ